MTVAFEGSEGQLRVFLESAPQLAYVYILALPEGAPFYVGEGKNGRIFQHVLEARLAHRSLETNPYKCNVIRKIENSGQEIVYRIDRFHSEKSSALKREGELIRHFRRLHEGGPLTNLAGGHENSGSPAPYSIEKHERSLSGEANDPQTRTLNMFFQSITSVKSVPIKPLMTFRSHVRRTTMQTKPDKFSARNAGAIVASAVCHCIPIQDGAVIPRRFVYNGIEAVIENGVCENITGQQVTSLTEAADPLDEKIVLARMAQRLIRDLLGD